MPNSSAPRSMLKILDAQTRGAQVLWSLARRDRSNTASQGKDPRGEPTWPSSPLYPPFSRGIWGRKVADLGAGPVAWIRVRTSWHPENPILSLRWRKWVRWVDLDTCFCHLAFDLAQKKPPGHGWLPGAFRSPILGHPGANSLSGNFVVGPVERGHAELEHFGSVEVGSWGGVVDPPFLTRGVDPWGVGSGGCEQTVYGGRGAGQ
jgi:hypothetical protein